MKEHHVAELISTLERYGSWNFRSNYCNHQMKDKLKHTLKWLLLYSYSKADINTAPVAPVISGGNCSHFKHKNIFSSGSSLNHFYLHLDYLLHCLWIHNPESWRSCQGTWHFCWFWQMIHTEQKIISVLQTFCPWKKKQRNAEKMRKIVLHMQHIHRCTYTHTQKTKWNLCSYLK